MISTIVSVWSVDDDIKMVMMIIIIVNTITMKKTIAIVTS